MALTVRSGIGRAWRFTPLAVAAVMAITPAAATAAGKSKAKAKPKVTGAVYTETNSTTKNQVVSFAQYSDGSLKQAQKIATGGKGGNEAQPETGPCLPPPLGQANCPNLDTQGELALSGKKLLFAVNAGSSTVTSFQITPAGLVRADVVKSGGKFPNSITTHGHWLYVLNANSASIAGFTFNSAGKLTPIKGSIKNLAANVFPGLSRQIAFDNTGKWLVVTKFGNPFAPGGPSPKNSIDVFKVAASGKPSAPITSDSHVPLPFSINFDSGDRILLTDVGNPTATGFVETLRVLPNGHLAPVQAPISSSGNAPCWGAITKRGFWYVVNADALGPNGATVAVYKVTGGHLTFKGTTPQIGETLKTDEALSGNEQYLYVLAPTSNRQAGGSHIDEYKILANGGLKLIGKTPKTLAKSVNGLVAW